MWSIVVQRLSRDEPDRSATGPPVDREDPKDERAWGERDALPASSAATAAIATVAAIAATTAAAIVTRLRLVHFEAAPFHLILVELIDRLLRGVVVAHFDESETARLPGESVSDDVGRHDLAGLAEQL